jgi:uncharacterized protein (TIGR03083 family)
MAERLTTSEYLEHLRGDSDRFLEVLLGADPAAPVPSCPDWNADDLLWHLAEVQWFWAEVVRTRTDDPDTVEAAKPDRPTGREGLTAFFREATASLQGALTAASPEDRAWTWAAEQTVGFVVRRQAHEALIHRVDAELTAGSRTPMDPRLSADGVDEVLRVMFSDLPAWASFTPDPEGPLRRGDGHGSQLEGHHRPIPRDVAQQWAHLRRAGPGRRGGGRRRPGGGDDHGKCGRPRLSSLEPPGPGAGHTGR